jgi:molybdenum cofactor cytidylyltransferase
MGGAKLTRPWRGGVLLDGALRAAFAAPARQVWVVTGADPAVSEVARRYAARWASPGRLQFVHARDHALGMGASLAAGIAALPSDATAAFVFLGDMPAIPVAILPLLAHALSGGAAAPVVGGRRGHPVLFHASLFGDLERLRGDEGARRLLAGLGTRVALVETDDEGVLFDVDTEDGWRSTGGGGGGSPRSCR